AYNLDPGSTITIVDTGGDDTIDFSSGVDGENVDIGSEGGTATRDDGDGHVIYTGTVESFVGTQYDDTFTDQTTQPQLNLDDGPGEGDDTYHLDPGSTITVVDTGGDDTIDFSSGVDGENVDIGTNGGTATRDDGDGHVFYTGTVESFVGTQYDDTFTDQTTQPQLNLDGGPGNGDDTYNLDPGSTITVVDTGGDDTIDFSSGVDG